MIEFKKSFFLVVKKMYKKNHEKTPVNALIIGVPNSVVKSSNKGGQFTISTLLITLNYPVLSHRYSTIVF